MIQPERIQRLNRKPIQKGRFVIYWMQAAQRSRYNHALEYAIDRANELEKPLWVLFGLTDNYPSANLRHYQFMLEGLKETQTALVKRGIYLHIEHLDPVQAAIGWAEHACLLVTDMGYLDFQRRWRRRVARAIGCPLIQVETNSIVSVEAAYPKEAWSAAGLRPKIHKQLERFLVPLRHRKLKYPSGEFQFNGFDITNTQRALAKLDINRSVLPVTDFIGGTKQAEKHLRNFIKNKLEHYAEKKNHPAANTLSNLSPYLHFGQISPLHIALQINASNAKGKETFLEELIVRRELANNFVYYNRKYATLSGLPTWARANLKHHSRDRRKFIYTLSQLKNAQTHDPYWNAAQMEMKLTGKMHGYMRMYWGKKILEWTNAPQTAYRRAVYLNDTYSLDGRDPNGYTGIAWCFGKHDRPWIRRAIFGTVRYMNAAGLERKFDMAAYLKKIDALRAHHTINT